MNDGRSQREKEQKKLIENPDPLVVGATGAGALVVALAAAIGGWIGYSALKVNHARQMPLAIDTERRTFVSAVAGALSYYQNRTESPALTESMADATPLVLIHSINAAGSSYEMRPLFEHYRTRRPVYALDLPGFGFSDRGRRVYSPALYTHAIVDFVSSQVKTPVDAIALSLGSEFLARAALERPDLFRSLTLISPSGMYSRKAARGSQRANQNNGSQRLYRAFSFPLWAQAFYDLLATRASIRYFLKRSFQGQIDPGLLQYSFLTAHQPGAKNAPLYFVSGKLFSADIFDAVYSKLTLPVQVIYDRDQFVKFDRLAELTTPERPNWHATKVTPTLGLPQFERLADTVASIDALWAEMPR